MIVEQIAVEMFDVSEIWSVAGLHDHAMHVACAQTVSYSEHATYSEVVPWSHHVPVPLVEPRVIGIIDESELRIAGFYQPWVSPDPIAATGESASFARSIA